MDKIDTKGPFLNFINKRIQLDGKKSEHILKLVHYQQALKNTMLVQPGEICKKFYYIVSGGIRIYYVTPEGREKTRVVLFENSPFTAFNSFITARPSVELIEVLEDSHFAVMTRDDFFHLVDEMPEWSTFYRKMLERTFVYQHTGWNSLLHYPPGSVIK